MHRNSEVIALLLADPDASRPGARSHARGAQRLVRDADGRISLEAIESQREFDETARITGCFRRGRAIRDPSSREIIGYEMEEVELGPVAAAV